MYIYILMNLKNGFSRVTMDLKKVMEQCQLDQPWEESTICKSGAVWRQWDNGYWHIIETKVCNPFEV